MVAGICAPDYGRGSLAELLPSVCDGLRVPGFWDYFELGEFHRAIVVVIDGLGYEQLHRHESLAPVLSGADRGPITTVFPSTTPTALTSLGTGLAPGVHGLIGATFRMGDQLFAPLGWGQEPPATVIQPEPTCWERAASAGVHVAIVSPRPYRDGGLTGSAFRGGRYIGADAIGERVAEIHREIRNGTRSLVYGYWEGLDKVGHVHGVASPHYRAELAMVDQFIAALRTDLPADTALIVTADHGMVDCDTAVEVDGADLLTEVSMLAGEPRMRQVYARPGRTSSVLARWQEELLGQAEVISRDEAIDREWFGEVTSDHRDRIGDVLALADSGIRLVANSRDSILSGLRGQHGALTEAEILVPLAVFRD